MSKWKSLRNPGMELIQLLFGGEAEAVDTLSAIEVSLSTVRECDRPRLRSCIVLCPRVQSNIQHCTMDKLPAEVRSSFSRRHRLEQCARPRIIEHWICLEPAGVDRNSSEIFPDFSHERELSSGHPLKLTALSRYSPRCCHICLHLIA